jgi:ferredoxin
MKPIDLELALKPYGLHLRGLFALNDDDKATLTQLISKLTNKNNLAIALVGNIGSSFWPQFTSASEHTDGMPDPLDRWSKRVTSQLEKDLDTAPLFPSDGPPYFPFQQWAKRAEGLSQSPMGLLIHPQYGLWHAYRFALILSTNEAFPESAAIVESPCISCAEQPCLNTCPVEAFTTNGYNIPKCTEYLKLNTSSNCNQKGCQARLACPVGNIHRYVDAQHLFHLKAFVEAQQRISE